MMAAERAADSVVIDGSVAMQPPPVIGPAKAGPGAERGGPEMKGQAPPRPSEMAPDERKHLLAQAVADALARPGGWQVESRSDYAATVVRGRRTNHVLHAILSLVTLGFWLVVWLIVATLNQRERQTLTVDPNGTVSTAPDGAVVRRTAPAAEGRAILPTTRVGWAAVRLAAAWVFIAFPVALVFYAIPGGEWVNGVVVIPVTLAAAVASGVLSLVAIIRHRERAVSVYAAVIPLAFLLVLLALELSGVAPEH